MSKNITWPQDDVVSFVALKVIENFTWRRNVVPVD